MIRDGSNDCFTFQQGIKLHAHKHAEVYEKNSPVLGECRKIDEMGEVLNINALKKQVVHKHAEVYEKKTQLFWENVGKLMNWKKCQTSMP